MTDQELAAVCRREAARIRDTFDWPEAQEDEWIARRLHAADELDEAADRLESLEHDTVTGSMRDHTRP